jgi:uncharacterized protein (TIGR02145 family)
VTTTAVTNITQTTATSGGNVISDGGETVTERGVCWSTSPNPTTANSKTTEGSGTGVFVSNLTGLTPNTPYYIRTYTTNTMGTSYGNEVNFQTLAIWSCGSSFTINHIAGAVAPVDKTVTYSTVSNIPGEPTKCWITRNLGASQQATAVSDNSEASAGWYWQFNIKQGYKHDGTTRTPSSAWTSNISENSDWTPTNDPCALELGSGWRVPTKYEWSNVRGLTGGNWIEWNGPWNSDLKLHAAGHLIFVNGGLQYRGERAFYWSSTQNSLGGAGDFEFDPNYCVVNEIGKSFGLPVRCLKDN